MVEGDPFFFKLFYMDDSFSVAQDPEKVRCPLESDKFVMVSFFFSIFIQESILPRG